MGQFGEILDTCSYNALLRGLRSERAVSRLRK